MLKQYYFTRPKEVSKLVLQKRDIKILDLVERFRFLDSLMIYKLIGLYCPGSDEVVKKRLHKLWASGFLNRPSEQVVLYLRNNQRHLVYCISKDGIELLADKMGKDIERLRWRLNQDKTSYKFLEHALEVSRFRTAVYLCQGEQELEVLFWRGDGELGKKVSFEIKTQNQEGLFRFKHLGERVTLTVKPDSFFGLRKEERIRFLALELDRGSRTVKDVALKLLAYYKLLQGIRGSPLTLDGYQISKFRVLLLAPSDLRIRHLQESVRAIAEKDDTLNRFWFARIDQVSLEKPSQILESIWQRADGRKVALLG